MHRYCNKTIGHTSNCKTITIKKQYNEYLESAIIDSIATLGRYRQGLWLYCHRFFINHLRLGSRSDCRFGDFEQPKIISPLLAKAYLAYTRILQKETVSLHHE